MAERLPNATLENAQIRFRNFSGKEGPYNKAGARSFAVFLEPEVAAAMAEDGWNIKQLKPRDEEPPQDYIQIKVNFAGPRPPQITVITSGGRNNLEEDSVGSLDWVDIAQADLIISPFNWEMNGSSGITAYLHKLFITVKEDDLDLKYAESMSEDPGDGGIPF